MENVEAKIGGEGVRPPTSPGQAALASFIGTATEYYDFFLYGTAAALVFGQLFFPNVSPIIGTLSAFATFGVGFFFRPLGGAFFGHFGDRIGRKAMLVITLLTMGSATFLIGLLPSFDSIGILAPILLVLLRAVQGFAVGGEWAGAALMSVEHAPQGRRGFFGSWTNSGAAAGFLLATIAFGIFSNLPEEQFLAWGWRVPFLLSVVVVAVGLFIRLRVAETPVFEEIKESNTETRLPIVSAFRDYPRNMLLIVGCTVGPVAGFLVATVFALSYATDQLGVDRSTMLLILIVGNALALFGMPLLGALSDRLGRRRMYMASMAIYALTIFPFFWLLETRSAVLIFLAYFLVINIAHSLAFAVTPAFFSELFGTRVRYSGVSIGYQLGTMIAGFSPLIATALVAASGGSWTYVAVYAVGGLLVSLVAAYLATDTYLEGTDPRRAEGPAHEEVGDAKRASVDGGR